MTTECANHSICEYGTFVNTKTHMLHALEVQMQIAQLWQPGRSLLDVGGGGGYISAYLMAKHGVNVTVFEVPFTVQCDSFLASPFSINFFFGRLPVPPRSYDAVLFQSVLHHAAEHTEMLLDQAALIARRWILVIEDLDVVRNRIALQKHDSNGIFRAEGEWVALLTERCRGFSLVRKGWVHDVMVGSRHGRHEGWSGSKHEMSQERYAVGIASGPPTWYAPYQMYFVMERTDRSLPSRALE